MVNLWRGPDVVSRVVTGCMRAGLRCFLWFCIHPAILATAIHSDVAVP